MFSFTNKIQSQTFEVCKDAEAFNELINHSKNLIHQGAAKEQLPVVTVHAVYDGEPRTNHTGRRNGMYLFENDDTQVNPLDLYNNKVKGHEKELGIAYMERSYNGKTHIWAVCPQGMGIQQSQQWLSQQLGVSYDSVCKDKARVMFLTGDVIYRDDELLFLPIPEQTEEEGVGKDESVAVASNATPISQSPLVKYNCVSQRWLQQNGGVPEEGHRHETLLKMARALLPTFGLPRQEVESIFSWVFNNCEAGMTPQMQSILDTLHEEVGDIDDEPVEDFISILKNEVLPFAPQIVKECVDAFDDKYQFAALAAILTASTVYLSNVHFRGCMEGCVVNGETKKGMKLYAILQTLLVAPPASGKASLTKLCEDWVQPCMDREMEGREMEDEWRDDSNDAIRPHPVRQIIAPDATRAALILKAKDAEERTLLQISDEMDSWIPTNDTEMKKKMATVRKGSNKEMDGSERSGKDSVSGMARIALSFYLAGTEDQRTVLTQSIGINNGGITRLSIFPLPNTAFTDRPGSVERTEEQMDEIHQLVDKLETLEGYISTPLIQQEMRAWDREQQMIAVNQGDEMRDLFRRRIADKALVFAGIYYVLKQQEQESPDVPRLARLYADYMMQNMLALYGNIQLQHTDIEQKMKQRGNKDMLSQLNSTFTYDDLKRLKPTLCDSSLRSITCRWIKAGMIKKEGNSFIQLQ